MTKYCFNYDTGEYEYIDKNGYSYDQGEYVYNWDDSEYKREEEEEKRKVRIAAGGIQAIYRLRKLLNPFRYGILSFQYVSHR